MTPLGNGRDAPRIDGWSVLLSEDGRLWTATRLGGLSAAQLEYGRRLRVSAFVFWELEVQCVAENIKAGIVCAAERLAERMAEADRRRAMDGRPDICRAAAEREPGVAL